jgi:hypothetical protein
MSQIQILQTEVQAIQSQIAQLRIERLRLVEQSVPIPTGNLQEIVLAAKSAAVTLAERQPQIQGVEDAIAFLEQQLLPKQRVLAQLKLQAETEQRRYELEHQQAQLQPELHALAHEINGLSDQMDVACSRYREMALLYNKVASELKHEPVYPISMNISGVPHATTKTGRGFNLHLGMRQLGAQVNFEQQVKPYVLTPNYSTSMPERIAIQQGFIVKMQQALQQLPAWDKDRILLYKEQIAETERQIKLLEQQQKEEVA